MKSLEKLFLAGDYRGILSLTFDRGGHKVGTGELVPVIASLCFLGRVSEAEALLAAHRVRLLPEQEVAITFFLGIGLVRISEYSRARRHFAQNLKRLEEKTPKRVRFFAHQGVAFYRYYCGKWSSAARHSLLALESAIHDNFSYGRILSGDLRGHVLVQSGEVLAGLRLLGESAELAEQAGNSGVARAIRIAHVCYEAQFGLKPKRAVAELRRELRAATLVQDNYSRANLLLELARQLLLRGQFDEGATALDEASREIHTHRNRRQELTLNLRYAYLSHLRGEDARGLSFVRSAKLSLDPHVDNALALALDDLEVKLLEKLGMKENSQELLKKLKRRSSQHSSRINQRILARRENSTSPDVTANDPLGSLIDNITTGDKAHRLTLIKNHAYFGLAPRILPELTGRESLFLVPDSREVILSDLQGIEILKSEITPLSHKLLEQISHKETSHAELAEKVWQHKNYHPLRHNPAIYQGIHGLRKILGTRSDWIQNTEKGWRLRAGVNVSTSKESTFDDFAFSSKSSSPHLVRSELNSRQISFLRHIKEGLFYSIHDYSKHCRVPGLTASRDLSSLCRSGHLLKTGKARATRYMKP